MAWFHYLLTFSFIYIKARFVEHITNISPIYSFFYFNCDSLHLLPIYHMILVDSHVEQNSLHFLDAYLYSKIF